MALEYPERTWDRIGRAVAITMVGVFWPLYLISGLTIVALNLWVWPKE